MRKHLLLLALGASWCAAPAPAFGGIIWPTGGNGVTASYICSASKAQLRRWGVPRPIASVITGWCPSSSNPVAAPQVSR
jgi:hypothetical protein